MLDTMQAKAKLEEKIEAGRASAMRLFERIQTDAPHDSIAKGKALTFDAAEILPRVGEKQAPLPVVEIGYGAERGRIHKNALGQLAQRAGVPGAYLGDLATGPAWQRALAADILNRHYHEGEPGTRFLLRAVQGEVRGFLSDRYRRLDSRPLVEAFAMECQKIGAVPVDGVFSDTRVSMRAIVPVVRVVGAGDVVAFGVEWGNSDFGNGTHALRSFILRLTCLNGATLANDLSQVHLGRGISDDVELSRRTYELDTRTSISALRDVVSNTLAPRRIEQTIATINAAHEKQVDWKSVKGGLSKALLKGEMKAAEDAFNGPDVYNLPPGNTMWRVSNAISWIAGQTEDADRKMELQRLAGQVIDGKADRVAA